MRAEHNLREIVDCLPEATVIVREGVAWEEYERLLEDLADRPGVRVTYDGGRLEIVTTSPGHERRKEFILLLAGFLCDALKIPMESFGQATWKRKRLLKGTEADTCFYVATAARVTGRDTIDLAVDPPPDIVVEIDIASQSDRKFPIYAAFGVPEIWRFKDGTVQFFALEDQSYVETPASRSFPILTSAAVTRFLRQSDTKGRMAALASFRNWLRRQRAR